VSSVFFQVPRFPLLLTILLFVWLAPCTPADGYDNWIEVRFPSFAVVSNAGDSEGHSATVGSKRLAYRFLVKTGEGPLTFQLQKGLFQSLYSLSQAAR